MSKIVWYDCIIADTMLQKCSGRRYDCSRNRWTIWQLVWQLVMSIFKFRVLHFVLYRLKRRLDDKDDGHATKFASVWDDVIEDITWRDNGFTCLLFKCCNMLFFLRIMLYYVCHQRFPPTFWNKDCVTYNSRDLTWVVI